MKQFMPERAYFESGTLEYTLGKHLYDYFKEKKIKIIILEKGQKITGIPGKTEQEKYIHAKKTVVITTKKTMDFDVCKPSADYQFPLYTSCPGNCEYCYLQTTQGKRPYIRIYVNIEDIFNSILKHIDKRKPDITTFEVASTSDPVSMEHLTDSLKRTIKFFSELEYGRLRLVTKFSNVDSLLNIQHNGHTRFRFSINADYVIRNFEHTTASVTERIDAARKVYNAGYPVGFIIAPIMYFEDWEEEYYKLFQKLSSSIEVSGKNDSSQITFELIQHRYTISAKNLIVKRFPKTKLDMDEETRAKKWGKYGKFKYIYPKEREKEIKDYIAGLIDEFFKGAKIEYFT